jgi:MoxR-like ATPase
MENLSLPEKYVDDLNTLASEVSKTIVGQKKLVDSIMLALLSNGHILIEGAPGLAKTLAVKSFAKAVQGSWSRIQFTPDLVPSDLIGSRMWNPNNSTFSTEKGPVFANFLLADEVNRAPAKVQSALLESMEERHVTIGKETLDLPKPFLVLATQNPIESEGTFQLPEAQLDRFLIKIQVNYPDFDAELEIVRRFITNDFTTESVLSTEQILELQKARSEIKIPRSIAEYMVSIVQNTRNLGKMQEEFSNYVSYGSGPRGTLALVTVSQGKALLNGRRSVTVTDVKEAAELVLNHRIILTYEAFNDGIAENDIIKFVIENTPEPSPGA